MRALVTGAAGFVGGWLARALRASDWEVYGTAIESAVLPPPGGADGSDGIRWLVGDIRDPVHIRNALDVARPDVIFHLAGIASVPAAAADPGIACEINVLGAARLLGEVRPRKRAGTLDPVVLVVGSAEQYGRQEAGAFPVGEAAAQRPQTVYAATKAAQEVIALEAFRGDGVRVVAVRSFNHSGAGQRPPFLLPSLVARALERRGAPSPTPLPIGNTDTVRDYLHVKDVVRAYLALATDATPGEAYNVCSGTGIRAATIAERVLARTGVSVPLRVDPALVRPNEVPVMVGDNHKLRAATGWSPAFTLDDILDDLIHAATH